MPDFEDSGTGDFILLGGQISNKIPEFKTIAQLDKNSAFIVCFLEDLERILSLSPVDQVKEIIKLNGRINFMNNCGELTKLSAIMGDTRKSYSSKGLKDVLRKLRIEPNP